MYVVYMIRCEDHSLYTGITSDLMKRMKEHFYKKPECAKYTKSHQAVCLEACWRCETRSEAAKLEYAIKHFSKADKEKIVSDPSALQMFGIAAKGNYLSVSTEEISHCMNEIKNESS